MLGIEIFLHYSNATKTETQRRLALYRSVNTDTWHKGKKLRDKEKLQIRFSNVGNGFDSRFFIDIPNLLNKRVRGLCWVKQEICSWWDSGLKLKDAYARRKNTGTGHRAWSSGNSASYSAPKSSVFHRPPDKDNPATGVHNR